MKGLFRRTRSPLPPSDPAPEVQPPTSEGSQPQVTAQVEALPAGTSLEDVSPRTSFRNRGRLRRRLRYLRRVRELGFRDLGGLAFDLHRFGRRNDELILGKLQALDAVDRELRALERALGDHRDLVELREPGIAACPRCGALHGSEARFCPACGTQFSGPLAIGLGAPPTAAGPSAPVEAAPAATPLSGVLPAPAPPATQPVAPEPPTAEPVAPEPPAPQPPASQTAAPEPPTNEPAPTAASTAPQPPAAADEPPTSFAPPASDAAPGA